MICCSYWYRPFKCSIVVRSIFLSNFVLVSFYIEYNKHLDDGVWLGVGIDAPLPLYTIVSATPNCSGRGVYTKSLVMYY